MPKKKQIDTTGWSPEEITAGEQLLPGLFRNGRLYSTRVKHPLTGVVKVVPTGTADIKRANNIRRMVEEFQKSTYHFQWIDSIFAPSGFTLDQIYTAKTTVGLQALVAQRDVAIEQSKDTDLEPLVDKWIDADVRGRTKNSRPIAEQTVENYRSDLRRLIPEGEPFRVSDFTGARVQAAINGARKRNGTKDGGLLGNTSRRNLLNTFTQFYEFARPLVGLKVNPFDDIPKRNRPKRAGARTTFWLFAPHRDEANVQDFIAALPGLYAKAIGALVFGAGAENGVLYKISKRDILGRDELTGQFKVRLEGTKVEGTRDRDGVLDEWAVPFVEEYVASLGKVAPDTKLFTTEQLGAEKAQRFREHVWYPLQVTLGWIAEPPKSEITGKPLWGQSKGKHDLHDGRHTYAIVRGFGLDGAEARDSDYLARNLGHSDTQMVTRVYRKMDGRRRDLVLHVAELIKVAKRKGGLRVVA